MPSGHPVALKFVNSAASRDPELLNAFERETRAVARMSHPSIVGVFEYGRVGQQLSKETFGVLGEGAPWIAMELLNPEPTVSAGWRTTMRHTLHLLGALGHAHARMTLHRDIKPSNVAFRAADERAVLVDFGLASFSDEDNTFASMLGTPHYSAPEQIVGDRWAQGPWTDLYSLGATVWHWLSGAPMFPSEDRDHVLAAHLVPDRPRLEPEDSEVPSPVLAWVESLVRCAPNQRPQHAAHASAGLRAALEDSPSTVSWSFPPTPSREWGRRSPDTELQLVGAGLELLSLREPQLVGRAAVQEQAFDALGGALRGAHSDAGRCLGFVSGAAGECSRFVRWLAICMSSQGVAREVRVPVPMDALRVVAGLLNTTVDGVMSASSREALARQFPRIADDVSNLVEQPDARWAPARLASVTLEMSVHVPLILVAEGAASAEWVRTTCEGAQDHHRLAGLVCGGEPRSGDIQLEPLSVLDLVRTVRELVGLEGRTADEIAARAGGSTEVLLRLLARLHQRGSLRVTKRGWAVSEDANWHESLRDESALRVAELQVADSNDALDAVALIGGWSPTGIASRWVDSKAAGRVADVLDRLGCLDEKRGSCWAFGEPERSAWVAAMSPSKRAALACEILADCESDSLPMVARVGLLLAAAQLERAWTCAVSQLESHLDSGSALGVFDSLSLVRDVALRTETRERRIELAIYEARVDSLLQRADKAIEAADRCLSEIRDLGESPDKKWLLAHALVAAGTPRALVSREDEAVGQLEHALELLPGLGRPAFELKARLMLGFVHYRMRSFVLAVEHAGRAIKIADAHCTQDKQGHARYALALFSGDADASTAARLFDEALALLSEERAPIQRAFALGASVFPLLELGEFDEAIRRAESNVELLERYNSREASLAKETLGRALARAGRWREAAGRLAEAEAEFRERGRSYDVEQLATLRLLCLLYVGDYAAAANVARHVGDGEHWESWMKEALASVRAPEALEILRRCLGSR